MMTPTGPVAEPARPPSPPSVLNIVRVANGWIVCVDTDLEIRYGVCSGKRFVFQTPEQLADGIRFLAVKGDLPVPLTQEEMDKIMDAGKSWLDSLDGMGRTD